MTKPLNYNLLEIRELVSRSRADDKLSGEWKQAIIKLVEDLITFSQSELVGLEQGMAIGVLTAEGKRVTAEVTAERERIIKLVINHFSPAGYDSGVDVTELVKKIRGEA